MNNDFTIDFFIDETANSRPDAISTVLNTIRTASTQFLNWPIDNILEIFDQFSQRLMDRSLELHNKYPNSGLAYIAGWCRKSHLSSILEDSFINRNVLDGFNIAPSRRDRAYRVLPKGLVVHWMAGNVPTLGFLSLVQGMLTKNANLIKVASSSDKLLADLLALLSTIEGKDQQSGKELLKSVAIIRYERTNKEIGSIISRNADVRIFWGNDESVTVLRNLPTQLHCNDIVFSNKTSLIVIDSACLQRNTYIDICRRIAQDICLFEQKACASPHTIFIESKDPKIVPKFAECLNFSLDNLLSSIPKTIPAQSEISAILNLRAQYDMFYQAWYSDGIEHSILSDHLFQLGPSIGNRTIFVRTVDNLDKVADLISPNVQTVGILASPDRFDSITNLYATKGAIRFTKIGGMTHFELPWDGYKLFHHLVRWVSRPHK